MADDCYGQQPHWSRAIPDRAPRGLDGQVWRGRSPRQPALKTRHYSGWCAPLPSACTNQLHTTAFCRCAVSVADTLRPSV